MLEPLCQAYNSCTYAMCSRTNLAGIFCLLQGRPLHYLKLENFAFDEICPPNSRTPWSGFYKAVQKIETDVLHVHGPNSLDFHAFLAGEMAASSVVAEITNDGRWHLGKESRRNQVQWPDWNTVVHRMEASLTKPKDLFSGLPPEIRNGIYRLLFEQRDDVYPLSGPHNSESKSSTPPERTLLCPGIGMLRASKLISMESCSIVYGNNVYNVMARKTTDIADWLETIGSRDRTSIKRLYLDWDHHIRGLDGAFLAQWTISSPHHPMIQQLVKPMETKVNLMNEALNGLWEDVHRELMASLLKCLDLLRDSYGITHLTVVIPMLYGIFWEADHICVAVEPPEQETTVEICNAIKMLRVSQKLRIGNMYEFDLAEPVGRAVDAAEIAIFDPDDDICDSGLDWPEQWINDEDLHELRLELALRGGTRAMADFMTRWLGRQVQAPTVTTLV